MRENYGIRWSLFATAACSSRTSASASRSSSASAPRSGSPASRPQVSVPIAAVAVWLLLVRGTYKLAERIFVADDDPVLRLPDRRDPLASALGRGGHAIVAPHVQTNPSYVLLFVATAGTTITPFMQLYLQSTVVERGLGPDDLNRERIEVVARLDLREPRRELHHRRDRCDALRAPPSRRRHGVGGGAGARAVRRQVRRGAVRDRPARCEPPRCRGAAGHRGVRHLRDVRLRAGYVALAARGARLRRRRDGARRDRRRGRDDPGRPRVPAARRCTGGQRRAAADHALLRLAALGECAR